MSAEPHAAGRQSVETATLAGRTAVSTQGLLRGAPIVLRDASYLLVALSMALSALLVVLVAATNDTIGFDFRGTLWEPGLAIWQGSSPYPAPVESEVNVGNPALYPPLLMFLVIPLSLLSWSLALTIWTLVGLASVLGALYLLGVRDLRCYGVALLCGPTVAGLAWGNATLLLLPLVALAWRWRHHTYRAGIVLGFAIAAKLFLWPLVFWLLGTRRYRAAASALAVGGAAILAPWAVIGFAGFTSYPDLLRLAEDIYATHSFSVATILNAIGVDAASARSGRDRGSASGWRLSHFVLGRRVSR